MSRDSRGNRRKLPGGTVGRHRQYLPSKSLSKNPLDILKGYLVREKGNVSKKQKVSRRNGLTSQNSNEAPKFSSSPRQLPGSLRAPKAP